MGQSVRIVYDRETREHRGIAFVDFTDTTEVDKAMTRNGETIKGGTDVEMRYEAPKIRPRPEGCLSVVVKKLQPITTEEDVKELFKGLKSLLHVRVIPEKG